MRRLVCCEFTSDDDVCFFAWEDVQLGWGYIGWIHESSVQLGHVSEGGLSISTTHVNDTHFNAFNMNNNPFLDVSFIDSAMNLKNVLLEFRLSCSTFGKILGYQRAVITRSIPCKIMHSLEGRIIKMWTDR